MAAEEDLPWEAELMYGLGDLWEGAGGAASAPSKKIHQWPGDDATADDEDIFRLIPTSGSSSSPDGSRFSASDSSFVADWEYGAALHSDGDGSTGDGSNELASWSSEDEAPPPLRTSSSPPVRAAGTTLSSPSPGSPSSPSSAASAPSEPSSQGTAVSAVARRLSRVRIPAGETMRSLSWTAAERYLTDPSVVLSGGRPIHIVGGAVMNAADAIGLLFKDDGKRRPRGADEWDFRGGPHSSSHSPDGRLLRSYGKLMIGSELKDQKLGFIVHRYTMNQDSKSGQSKSKRSYGCTAVYHVVKPQKKSMSALRKSSSGGGKPAAASNRPSPASHVSDDESTSCPVLAAYDVTIQDEHGYTAAASTGWPQSTESNQSQSALLDVNCPWPFDDSTSASDFLTSSSDFEDSAGAAAALQSIASPLSSSSSLPPQPPAPPVDTGGGGGGGDRGPAVLDFGQIIDSSDNEGWMSTVFSAQPAGNGTRKWQKHEKKHQQEKKQQEHGHPLTGEHLLAMGVRVQKRRRTSKHTKMAVNAIITFAVVAYLYVVVIHPLAQGATQQNCQGRWRPNGHCICHGGELGLQQLAYEVVQHAVGGGLPCDDVAGATSEYRHFMPDDLGRFCHCPRNKGARAKVGERFEQILGAEGGPGPWQVYDADGVQPVLPGRRYEFVIEQLPTDPAAIRSNLDLLHDLSAAAGGELDPSSYSAQMVAVCSAHGMKPVCNHAAQCEHDNHSLYIGQAGELTLSGHRQNMQYNPSGYERIAQNWQGLCSYTSAAPMHAQYWFPGMSHSSPGLLDLPTRFDKAWLAAHPHDMLAITIRLPGRSHALEWSRMELVTPATAHFYGIFLDSHGSRVPCDACHDHTCCCLDPPNGTCQDSEVCAVTQGEVQGNRTLCEDGHGTYGYRWDGLTKIGSSEEGIFMGVSNGSIGWFNTSHNPGFMCGRVLTKEDQMNVPFVHELAARNGVPTQVYQFMAVRLNASVAGAVSSSAGSRARRGLDARDITGARSLTDFTALSPAKARLAATAAADTGSSDTLYRVADDFQSCDALWLSQYSRDYDSCDEPKNQNECFAGKDQFRVPLTTKIDPRPKPSYARCDAKIKEGGKAQLNWRPKATGTCTTGKYPCVCVCRRGGDPDGGKGHLTSYSAAMVHACAEHGLKPICNDPRYCQYDPNALYIGQSGTLSTTADRYSPGMMPPGFQAIADKWAGLCGYTGTNASIVGRQSVNKTLCDMTWAHIGMQWRTVAHNPGFMCGKVMTEAELRRMYAK